MVAKEKKDSQQALLDAAKKLFGERGFDAVTVQDIAQAAGVNVSLVSYHFQGKEGLFRACIEKFGQERLFSATRIFTPPESVEDFRVKLKLWIEEFLQCHVEQEDVTKIIHRDCLAAIPMIRDLFENTFLKVFQTLVAFFIAAQKKGIVQKSLDPQLTTMFFFGSLVHVTRMEPVQKEILGVSIHDPKFRAQVVEQLLSVFMKGIVRSDK